LEPGTVLEEIARLSRTPRAAGSKGDSRAFDVVRAGFEAAQSFDLQVQSFEFEKYAPVSWRLTIEGSDVDCMPALCSLPTPRGGIEGIVCRFNDPDVSGKVALLPISQTHESIEVEKLAGRGAAAALVFDDSGGPGMLAGRVRYPQSSIPSLMIRRGTAKRLWRDAPKRRVRVRLIIRARTEKGFARNIYAVPRSAKGASLFVGHRDSRPFSPGAVDNASGTAFLLFLSNLAGDPQFSLLSTDAEEYGLLGAHHFMSEDNGLDPGTSVVNLDSIGSGRLHLVGRSRAGVLSAGLNGRISSVARGLGFALPRLSTPRGSDCDVFLRRGFKACWLRSYPTPSATTTEDTVDHIKLNTVAQCCRLLGLVVSGGLAIS
jgi:aminopeptidase YwaD